MDIRFRRVEQSSQWDKEEVRLLRAILESSFRIEDSLEKIVDHLTVKPVVQTPSAVTIQVRKAA